MNTQAAQDLAPQALETLSNPPKPCRPFSTITRAIAMRRLIDAGHGADVAHLAVIIALRTEEPDARKRIRRFG